MLPGALVIAAALGLYTTRGFRLADFMVAFGLAHLLDLLLLAGIPWALPPKAPAPVFGSAPAPVPEEFAGQLKETTEDTTEETTEDAGIPDSPFAAPRVGLRLAERPVPAQRANPFASTADPGPEVPALPPFPEPSFTPSPPSPAVPPEPVVAVRVEEEEPRPRPPVPSPVAGGRLPGERLRIALRQPVASGTLPPAVVSPAGAAAVPPVEVPEAPAEEYPEQPLNPS